MTRLVPLGALLGVAILAGCANAPVTTPPSPATTPSAPAPPPPPSPAPPPPPPPPVPAPPPPPPAVPGEPLGSPVTNAATTSAGDVPHADDVVVALRPAFKRCYETTRGKGPEIAGMVSCGVRIDKAGKVAAISVTRRDRLPNPLVACIVATLKTARFEPLAEETVIQVPVRFAVPGED